MGGRSMSKGKKRKQDDEDEPITYINDRNKVFNKKVSTVQATYEGTTNAEL